MLEHRKIRENLGSKLHDEKNIKDYQQSRIMDPYQKSHELNTEFYSSYPPEVIEHEFINYLIRNNLEYEKDPIKY